MVVPKYKKAASAVPCGDLQKLTFSEIHYLLNAFVIFHILKRRVGLCYNVICRYFSVAHREDVVLGMVLD